jgi:hypothetical protein
MIGLQYGSAVARDALRAHISFGRPATYGAPISAPIGEIAAPQTPADQLRNGSGGVGFLV